MTNRFLPISGHESSILADFLERTLANDVGDVNGTDEPLGTLMGLITRLRTGLVDTTSVTQTTNGTVHGSNFQFGHVAGSLNINQRL
jgi:hypothetical protein